MENVFANGFWTNKLNKEKKINFLAPNFKLKEKEKTKL